MSLVIDPKSGMYSRSISTKRMELSNLILASYGRDKSYASVIFPSGMAAISATMTQNMRFSIESSILIGNELYCDSPKVAKYLNKAVFEVDIKDTARILELVKTQNFDFFFFESCTNPSGEMFNFGMLGELKKIRPHMRIICDNTWLSSTLFNPFLAGPVDYVVESMTKYVSGGRCIGGYVIGKQEVMKPLIEFSRLYGQHVPDTSCQLFIDAMAKQSERVNFTSRLTLSIAKELEKNYIVSYPLLESSPTFRLAQKYLRNGGPSCIWFRIPCTKNGASGIRKKLRNNPKISWVTSFGSPGTKFDPWPKYYKGGLWVRLAIGYESTEEEILEGLKHI